MAQTKNIDIIPNNAIKRVHVSQGDIGRTINFNLYEGSLAYTPTSGDVITCVGTKPSGLGFTVNCTWSGNVVTCVTTEGMTDESGSIETELVITSSDETTVLGTSNFVLVVEKNPHPDTTTDGNMETLIPELTLLVNEVKGYAEEIEDTYHAYGSPWVASTVSAMTDTSKIYVYTGSETGYTSGNWYYYNGTAWVSGGVYNAVTVQTDTTLTQSGMPADAKAVGDEISDSKDDITALETVIDGHTSTDYRVPAGTMVIVKGGGSNASFDSDTSTWTFPANTNCGGTSLGYRYTAQEDDMGTTIRFVVHFNATVYNQSANIQPLVYWNYVDVTSQSYVVTEMHDDYCIFDVTIPNERKNLDVRLYYVYYGNVGYDTTLQVTGVDYYYLPVGDTYYTFDSNFIGKKMTPFGDSYTAQGKWQPFVKARLGLASYSGFSQDGGTLTSVYAQISNLDTTADIVTVWIGTNDYGNNRKVGTLLDDVTDTSIQDAWGYTTFCAALNYVCDWLSNNMKGKCIVFITPTQRFDSIVTTFETNNGKNSKDQVLNNAGHALEEYADAMIMVANYWGYPVCDMYHESGINKNSYTAFYQGDALHPSEAGAELLAQKIATFINSQI